MSHGFTSGGTETECCVPRAVYFADFISLTFSEYVFIDYLYVWLKSRVIRMIDVSQRLDCSYLQLEEDICNAINKIEKSDRLAFAIALAGAFIAKAIQDKELPNDNDI